MTLSHENIHVSQSFLQEQQEVCVAPSVFLFHGPPKRVTVPPRGRSMTALKTNLKHQVKQTPLPKWKPPIPVFEAVMNSIQSISEREPNQPGRITIDLHRERGLLQDENPQIDGLTITDNGVGLDDDNFNSFNTAFSDYKESKGGKGLGRFTWLKALKSVMKIVTTFLTSRRDSNAGVQFTENYDPDTQTMPKNAPGRQLGIKGEAGRAQGPVPDQYPKTADQFIQRLVEHFLLIFLEPNRRQIVCSSTRDIYSANDVFEKDFKATARVHKFTIKGAEFTLHGFKLTTPRVSTTSSSMPLTSAAS